MMNVKTPIQNVTRQRFEQEPARVSREILALPVTALTTSGVTVYTVPSNASFQLRDFIVTNYTAASATFDMNIVESGGSAGNSNLVYDGEAVAAHDTVSPLRVNMWVAPAGSAIVFTASANSTLNIIMHGVTVYDGDLA